MKTDVNWEQYSDVYLTHRLEQYKYRKHDDWVLSAIKEIRAILKDRKRITLDNFRG